jgi:oxygen-independent coproporphyrinogen-3 oxidase
LPNASSADSTGTDAVPTPQPLALYVHLPWCLKKCPYCDFNSHAPGGVLPFDAYVDALLADLDFDCTGLGPLPPLQSIFFGGGTPSLFPPATIARVLDGVAARLALADGIEISLEANPGATEYPSLAALRAAGVNRLSFGVQSFDDGCLQRLGRIHGCGEALAAVRAAQDAGFDNLNLDLMYALPGQSLAMALDDLHQAIALGPSHLSHYHLTLEPNTLFAARPPADLPDDDLAWRMQADGQALLAATGYTQYEVSAYARPGRQCVHNLNYWRYGDYLGIGAGAHGKLSLAQGLRRRARKTQPAGFMAGAGQRAAIGSEAWIDGPDRAFEFMLNRLRLREGFTLADFERCTGLAAAAIEAPLAEALARGWLVHDPATGIATSDEGRRLNNDLVALFLPA